MVNTLFAFFPSLKQNFIAYRSSKMSPRPDCIFEMHQLWQSGFSRVYSNSGCSCLFKPEIIKIGLSSHKMNRKNILNFQESAPMLNACTKNKSWNLFNSPRIYVYMYARKNTSNHLNYKHQQIKISPTTHQLDFLPHMFSLSLSLSLTHTHNIYIYISSKEKTKTG